VFKLARELGGSRALLVPGGLLRSNPPAGLPLFFKLFFKKVVKIKSNWLYLLYKLKTGNMKKTVNLWGAIDGEVLCGRDMDGFSNAVQVDINQDTDDGTFPTLASYTRAVNQIEDNGISAWINRMTRKKSKLEIDLGEFKIIREDAADTGAVIEFKEPIEVWHAKVGETQVTSKVKKIKGEFFHDYFWTRAGRQDKIANGFEVWFSIEEYLE
jgi:hypothetical protein